MGHLVDAHRHRQDDDIVLAGIDGNAVAVAHAEPLSGDLSNLRAPVSEGRSPVRNAYSRRVRRLGRRLWRRGAADILAMAARIRGRGVRFP